MPKFSIIIPVYNVAPYLRECLDSLLAQTYADWEAICVDDGSSDGSGEILDEYGSRDNRVRVIHQKNAGVSVARNRGLEVMRGEWFLFLDGDDMFRPDALEHFVQVIEEYNCDAILMQPYVEWLDREEVVATEPFKVIQQMQNGVHLMTGEISANGFPFGRVYKTSIFGNLRFCAGIGMIEDVLFWSDAIGVSANWIAVKGSYYYYRQHTGSVSKRFNFNRFKQIIDVNLMVFKRIMVFDDTGRAFCKYWRRYRWLCEHVMVAFAQWNEYDIAQRQKIMSYKKSVNAIYKGVPYSFDFRVLFLLHQLNLHCLYRIALRVLHPKELIMRVVQSVKRRQGSI